jgi:hypothetical protein
MASPCAQTPNAARAYHSELLFVNGPARRPFAIEFDAEMMRRDGVIVNEMEFRMLHARKGLSPRSWRATTKRFSV